MPDWKQEILKRLAELKLPPAREAEIVEELSQHLEERFHELVLRGATEDAARKAVLAELSDRTADALVQGLRRVEAEMNQEPVIAGGGGSNKFFSGFWQDLRYGARMLRKNPGFTAVAVVTLALGIGASTAIFSVVNAVLLQPLPYSEPARLVTVNSVDSRRGPAPAAMSYPDFFDFRSQNHVFDHLITNRDTNMVLTGAGQPMQLDAEMVTWDLFQALGIQPQLGRGFVEPEEAAGSHVVVLSHAFWQSQFGGDPRIVGETITLNAKPYAVVGVAPAGFVFPVEEPGIQVWTTIAGDREAEPGDKPMTEQRGAHMFTGLGRLRPGATLAQAQAELNVIAGALAKQYPDSNSNHPKALVRPALDALVGSSRLPLMILFGSVGLVLLIACANIANLLLARTVAREHEMAVRAAMGASRARTIRQLLTECLLLAMLGGAGGVALSEGLLRLVLPLGGQSIPRLAQASVDGRVLVFSLLLALVTTLIFGVAPALRASKVDLTSSLKEQSRGTTSSHDRLRGSLVIAQVTLGMILVSAAGLLMSSLLRLEKSDLGLRPDHLISFSFNLPEAQYKTEQQLAFYDRALEQMRAIPGVKSAAGVWPVPLGGDNATVSFDLEEHPQPKSKHPSERISFCTPDYFSTAGIPLLKGRFFSDHDDKDAPRVMIVNKAFAEKYFPGEEVVGKRVTTDATGWPGEKESPHEIVGVVGSTKLFALDAEPKPAYYLPMKQLPWMLPPMMLRTDVPPRTLETAIRKKVAELDPQVPVFQFRTMDDLLSTQVMEPRFHTLLLACFAAIALLLTMVGLYGVMAYTVTRRTREFGVRIALGARRGAVLAMVLKQALVLVGVGLALGAIGSLVADRLLRSMLYNASSLNISVLVLSTLLVALTGLIAAYVPARRATKVDPIVALRYE